VDEGDWISKYMKKGERTHSLGKTDNKTNNTKKPSEYLIDKQTAV